MKRYDCDLDGFMDQRPDGDYVLYDDAQAEVEAARAEHWHPAQSDPARYEAGWRSIYEESQAAIAASRAECAEVRKVLADAVAWARNLWMNQDMDCDYKDECWKLKRCLSIEKRGGGPEWFKAALGKQEEA